MRDELSSTIGQAEKRKQRLQQELESLQSQEEKIRKTRAEEHAKFRSKHESNQTKVEQLALELQTKEQEIANMRTTLQEINDREARTLEVFEKQYCK